MFSVEAHASNRSPPTLAPTLFLSPPPPHPNLHLIRLFSPRSAMSQSLSNVRRNGRTPFQDVNTPRGRSSEPPRGRSLPRDSPRHSARDQRKRSARSGSASSRNRRQRVGNEENAPPLGAAVSLAHVSTRLLLRNAASLKDVYRQWVGSFLATLVCLNPTPERPMSSFTPTFSPLQTKAAHCSFLASVLWESNLQPCRCICE